MKKVTIVLIIKIKGNKLIQFIMFPGNEKGIEKLKLVQNSN